MYPIGPEHARIWTNLHRNSALQTYGRLEYGSPDVGWILAAARATKPSRRTRTKPSLRVRLRYFVNSFRGFAALDIHGHDDTGCP